MLIRLAGDRLSYKIGREAGKTASNPLRRNEVKAGTSWRRRLIGASVLAVLGLGAPAAAQDNEPLGDLPLNPEWLSNTLERASKVGQVENNTIAGALARRDAAAAAYTAALKAGKHPSPLSKPEYTVMWSGKQNA